jgi:hypothetical protein
MFIDRTEATRPPPKEVHVYLNMDPRNHPTSVERFIELPQTQEDRGS